MKKYILAACLAVIATPATAGEQDFVVLNKTGFTIEQVYVSESSKDEWEEDVLGQDVLAPDARTKITFSRDTRACLWDLKVVYDDGETAEWSGVNLCKISVVKLSYRSGNTYAEAE